jgi:hypothetical protein
MHSSIAHPDASSRSPRVHPSPNDPLDIPPGVVVSGLMRSDDVPVTPLVAGLRLGDGCYGRTFEDSLPLFDGKGARWNVHAPPRGDGIQTVVECRSGDPDRGDMNGQIRCHPGAPASHAPGMDLFPPSRIFE